MADTELDRAALSQQFVAALDVVERALHGCSEELWAASIWPVQRTDPWVWPRDGVPPIPERTDQSIQQLSAFCNVAYHCLWFLDFYVTTEVVEFQSPEYVRGGPEEQGMAADGAAPVPVKPCYPREVLLAYLAAVPGSSGRGASDHAAEHPQLSRTTGMAGRRMS
jgi:hypothetical protein